MSYNIIENYLTPNPYSRPQKPFTRKAIAIHWVANPNTTASGNRNYWENFKTGTPNPATGSPTYGSAHEIIDLDGSVMLVIPKNELAYGVGSSTYTQECITKLGSYPNSVVYSIECTHIDWTGKMTDATYNTLIERCADICIEDNLNPYNDIWTHKGIVGWKDCHRWFVNNPTEWALFLDRVNRSISLKKNPYPQWQIDLITALKNMKYIGNDHAPDEVVNIRLFAKMLDNKFTKIGNIDPGVYLMNNGYCTSYHDSNEPMTLGLFGWMMINKLKTMNVTLDPIEFLTKRNYISEGHKADEVFYLWIFGAISTKL